MRKVFGLVALAAVALQPAVAAAAPVAKASPALQSRQQSVQTALLQGRRANSQGPANASERGQSQANENSVLNDGQNPGQGRSEGPSPGRVNRTTVLSRVILFAPAAAVAGLLIALAAGGGRNRPISG